MDSFPNFFKARNCVQLQPILSQYMLKFVYKMHFDITNTINTHMKHKIVSWFEFQCMEWTAVHKIISDISVTNSCGVDGIPSSLLKAISPVITAQLAHMINQSLYTGIFPCRWKIAEVIPIHKKGDPHKVDKYIPISLLPVLSKVLERAASYELYARKWIIRYLSVWLPQTLFNGTGICKIDDHDMTW